MRRKNNPTPSLNLFFILALFFTPALSQVSHDDMKSLNGTLWTFDTRAPIHGSPTLKDGILYIGSNDQHLYALDARYGNTIWKTDVHLNIFGQAAVGDQMAYIGWLDGKIYAMNLLVRMIQALTIKSSLITKSNLTN